MSNYIIALPSLPYDNFTLDLYMYSGYVYYWGLCFDFSGPSQNRIFWISIVHYVIVNYWVMAMAIYFNHSIESISTKILPILFYQNPYMVSELSTSLVSEFQIEQSKAKEVPYSAVK